MAQLFLKLDGIQGESADAKHKGEIELAAFSWGVSNPVAVGGPAAGAGAGRPSFTDFSFQMSGSKASPKLFLACASGKHIKEASLSVRKAGAGALEYLKIKFTDVLVTSFQQSSSDEAPSESVAFNFAQVQFAYTSQDPAGAAGAVSAAGWDLSTNVKF